MLLARDPLHQALVLCVGLVVHEPDWEVSIDAAFLGLHGLPWAQKVTMVAYVAAFFASAFGWWLGSKFGLLPALFLSCIAGSAGLYFTRRWLAGMR